MIPVTTSPPKEKKLYPIAIIGAGAAGTMAVNRAVLNNNEALLFTGAKQEQRRSRGHWVKKVDNIPGLAKYERAVLDMRNEVLEKLMQGTLAHNLFIIEDSVYLIEKEPDFFKLTAGSGKIYYARYVVLATGMMNEQPLIQGSIRPILKYANGQTIAYCPLCDGHRSFGKKTVVIGHAESAAETALYLSENYKLDQTTILTNGYPHGFNPELIKELEERKIQIFEAPIQEVLGNSELRQLTGFKLESGDLIDAEIGFISLGIRPNNQLALQLGAEIDECGLVKTSRNGESNIPNLFVIGDLRADGLKQIYTAWQQAVETLELINIRLLYDVEF